MLSMGDDEARSMGVKTESLKFFIIACTTLITASAVSVSGIVGWVGLVIPHARPNDFRSESPLAAPDKYGVRGGLSAGS